MAEFDNKLKGVLFIDENGKRDFMGTVVTEDGSEYWVSGWKRKSKDGKKYISLALTPKDDIDNSPSNKKGNGKKQSKKDTTDDW